jgi:hypothetical protein
MQSNQLKIFNNLCDLQDLIGMDDNKEKQSKLIDTIVSDFEDMFPELK